VESPASALPPASALERPILDAIVERGRPLVVEELDGDVAQTLKLPPAALQILHSGAGKRTEFAYRMAWARTRLKNKGQLVRKAHKTWGLPDGTQGNKP
jgi:restriction system protein